MIFSYGQLFIQLVSEKLFFCVADVAGTYVSSIYLKIFVMDINSTGNKWGSNNKIITVNILGQNKVCFI